MYATQREEISVVNITAKGIRKMSPVVSPVVQPTSLVWTPSSPVGPGPAQYEHHARRGDDQLSTSLQPRRAKVIMEHKTIVRSHQPIWS